MNKAIIIGNLTANPQARVVNTQAGAKSVCEFTVATNRYQGGQQMVEYFRVSLWERAADNAMKYLAKGSKVAVSGPVTGRAYIGNDGKPRCSLEITHVTDLEYLSGRRDGAEANHPGKPESSELPENDSDLPL